MNQPNTYNQQGMPPQPMPPQGMPPQRERMMTRGPRLNSNIWPKWLTQYAVGAYLAALAVVTFMYSSHSLPWYYTLFGIVTIGVFFLYGSSVAQNTAIEKIRKPKNFEKRIFLVAFVLRLIFVISLYWIFKSNYGDAFGFENADATYYDELGQFVAGLISKGNFHFYNEISHWCGNDDISDMGYGIYLGLVYWLTRNSILAARLLKCVWSSITVVLIYRLAKRNFEEQTARIAAIFCALWPNFWYYCSAHLKETEMVFLAVLFVEQADQMLRSRQFTAWKVGPVLLIAAMLFTFRTVLAFVCLLALLFTIVMSSTKVVSWGKRVIIGVLAVALVGVIAGNRLEERAKALIEQAEGGNKSSMEWRSGRENGNALAKYAGSAVFAPMIFTIPFPTIVRPFEGQEVQQLLHGGNYIKNILSGFTLLALFSLLLSGKWREHLLPLSLVLGYLVVLVFSSFPHSERFHQPAMPFEMMFAAYGLSVALSQRKYKRWYLYWCVLMFIAAIAWNWFKLKGRGLA